MDKEKTVEEFLNALIMQEDILQFTHFTNDDAWELGRLMVDEAKRKGLNVAISIRLNNGVVVFQHLMDKTNLDNIFWMERKFNTVKRMEMSSLRLFMQLKKNNQTMLDKFLDETEYACCGGGFPIRLEDSGVIGVVLVSGLNHALDHDFIIKCLSKYLHMDEVPRIKQPLY
ncbi:MAG: heme-degrading domain-containing protein [Lachnospiraceae bacterium]|nr:heme-degrading domain-containing protein [Lachnospiraceae bacterium]